MGFFLELCKGRTEDCGPGSSPRNYDRERWIRIEEKLDLLIARLDLAKIEDATQKGCISESNANTLQPDAESTGWRDVRTSPPPVGVYVLCRWVGEVCGNRQVSYGEGARRPCGMWGRGNRVEMLPPQEWRPLPTGPSEGRDWWEAEPSESVAGRDLGNGIYVDPLLSDWLCNSESVRVVPSAEADAEIERLRGEAGTKSQSESPATEETSQGGEAVERAEGEVDRDSDAATLRGLLERAGGEQ